MDGKTHGIRLIGRLFLRAKRHAWWILLTMACMAVYSAIFSGRMYILKPLFDNVLLEQAINEARSAKEAMGQRWDKLLEILYIVAALETMKSRGWLPRLMAYNGTICVKRTWREGDRAIQRPVDPEDIEQINTGLRGGWVLTYPQGTTNPGAPGRMGCAQIIKHFRPIVVPVRLKGLREAFDKTGLRLRKRGLELSVRYGRALDIDYDRPVADILATVMASIGEVESPEPMGSFALHGGEPA